MLEVTVRYSEFDNKIIDARVPINETTTEVFTINNVPEGMSKSVKIDISDNSSPSLISTKTYDSTQLLSYIRLLNKILLEIRS